MTQDSTPFHLSKIWKSAYPSKQRRAAKWQAEAGAAHAGAADGYYSPDGDVLGSPNEHGYQRDESPRRHGSPKLPPLHSGVRHKLKEQHAVQGSYGANGHDPNTWPQARRSHIATHALKPLATFNLDDAHAYQPQLAISSPSRATFAGGTLLSDGLLEIKFRVRALPGCITRVILHITVYSFSQQSARYAGHV